MANIKISKSLVPYFSGVVEEDKNFSTGKDLRLEDRMDAIKQTLPEALVFPVPKGMKISLPSKEELSKMPHSELYRLRGNLSKEEQAIVAPYEHRAFARELVQENPAMAASLAFAIPSYTAAKATGAVEARTPASMEEMEQAFVGMYEGIIKKLKETK